MAGQAIVIGAGIGGLVAALDLCSRGLEVTVLESQAAPGGKMRRVTVNGQTLDGGPTVFTMRPLFERIFADAGATLSDHLKLRPAQTLARHAWDAETQLDLFADPLRSAEAIGAMAGASEARGFLAFSAEARRIYQALENTFIYATKPNPLSLMLRAGWRGLPEMLQIQPFIRLWDRLGYYFKDIRLRQLFGRYATYCGASPFLAPATLMLVAQVEANGVWLVEGGMHQLALALAGLVESKGGRLRYGTAVRQVLLTGGRASGVELVTGERLGADAVVVNADPAALGQGLLGDELRAAIPPQAPPQRSLSALVWTLIGEPSGFPLLHHTVFFSRDYRGEFAALRQGRICADPTVYVCAQDRDGDGRALRVGPERLYCLINAPSDGDQNAYGAREIERCAEKARLRLQDCGLSIQTSQELVQTTSPADFNRLFPGNGGALYGMASHGWLASFRRPGARCKIPGLYLAGGGTHPGPGVPMAAMSGRLAAQSLLLDLASTAR